MTQLTKAIHKKNKQKVISLLNQNVDPTVDQPWMLAKALGQEEIANLLPKAFDEFFLLLFLKFLNYNISNKGICFGFAHMAKQAIMARQIDIFNQRLIFLAELYFIIEKQTLLAMNPKSPIKRSDKQFQYHLKNNFLHALDLLRQSDNPIKRQEYIDIIAFLDGIYLYQKNPNFCHVFPHNHFFSNNYSSQQASKIVTPKNIDIEYRGHFSGTYSKEMLQSYLQILQSTCQNFKFYQPISFILTSCSHAMILAYDPLIKQWAYGDSCNMPLKISNDIGMVAEKIISAFSNKNSVVFTTSFYTAHDDRKVMELFMQALLQNDEWKKIHTPNAESIKITSGKAKKYRWIQIASGAELKAIQKVQRKNQPSFLKYSHFLASKVILFLANKTRGNYEKGYDENNQPISVYQTLRTI